MKSIIFYCMLMAFSLTIYPQNSTVYLSLITNNRGLCYWESKHLGGLMFTNTGDFVRYNVINNKRIIRGYDDVLIDTLSYKLVSDTIKVYEDELLIECFVVRELSKKKLVVFLGNGKCITYYKSKDQKTKLVEEW